MSAFDRIIGYADIKAELERFCDVVKNFERYKKLGVTMPRGILLDGNPGIGKTLMAKCFIEESGCKSYLLRKDKPDGDFVNEIRNTFEKAKADSCAIVFLDDMDKFANEDKYHKDAEEYVTVQACIDDCKDTGVFVIATVNDRYCMPDSLTRSGRFDKVIEMKFPKGKDAKRIIEHYISQKNVISEVDIEEIARIMEGYSCAELESVINEAGIYAGFEKRDSIEHKDILKACMRMIFNAPESVDPNNQKYIKYIACHEAGHAIISEVFEPGSVSLVSVCRYSGSTEGITIVRKPDDYKLSKTAKEHEVILKLGGKAATEIIFGLVDRGCNSDLHQAFDLVTEFVDHYCSYGFDAFEVGNSSSYLLENRDRAVSKEMDKYYRQAKQIILGNRELLDIITQELIVKKTLTQKDIKALREKVAKIS